MDRLDAMSVFVKVVESGSFSRAADALGVGRPTVTRTIQNLESYLNAQLFQRSTRQVSITAEGERYYQKCMQLIDDLSDLEQSFSVRRVDIEGRLRIAMPAYVAKHFVIPRLEGFKVDHPNIQVSLAISEPKAEISPTGADCVLMLGPLPDSDLVARPLAKFQRITAVSEAFLRRCGVPAKLVDLQSFGGIRHGVCAGRHCDMSFLAASQPVHIRLQTQLAVDDTEAAIACAASGLGIVQTLRFLAQPYLASGQLLEIFPEHCPPAQSLFAVYPKMNHRSRALQAFVEWIHKVFEQSPALRICPVGFPGVAEAKNAARSSGLAHSLRVSSDRLAVG